MKPNQEQPAEIGLSKEDRSRIMADPIEYLRSHGIHAEMVETSRSLVEAA